MFTWSTFKIFLSIVVINSHIIANNQLRGFIFPQLIISEVFNTYPQFTNLKLLSKKLIFKNLIVSTKHKSY